jgi:hypothetical protein
VARRRGAIQEHILQELCGAIERLDDVDWQEAEHLIMQHLHAA